MILFILYLTFLLFLYVSRGWMMTVVCEERYTIKKNWYFNEMLCKIDNLTWGILKSEYIK